MAMDPLLSTMQQLIDMQDDLHKLLNALNHSYVHDTESMASIPVDVKEYPNSYASTIDSPDLKSSDIKVSHKA